MHLLMKYEGNKEYKFLDAPEIRWIRWFYAIYLNVFDGFLMCVENLTSMFSQKSAENNLALDV